MRHFSDIPDEDNLNFIEESKIMLLNRANRVSGLGKLFMGSITGTMIDTRMVFAAGLKTNVSGIILAHNHPSENLKLSSADRK